MQARDCARKIVATYKLCSEQLSSQDHYVSHPPPKPSGHTASTASASVFMQHLRSNKRQGSKPWAHVLQDYGMRAVMAVLRAAGNMKRK